VSGEQDRGSQEDSSHDTDRKGSAVSFKYNKHSLPFQTIFSNRGNIIKSFGQNMLIIFSTRKRGNTVQIRIGKRKKMTQYFELFYLIVHVSFNNS
jgi:hypothetical protein